MRRLRRVLSVAALVGAAAGIASAQLPRVVANWPTTAADAHRTSWMRYETKVSSAGMLKPGFQLLWKSTLDNEARHLNSLTQPLLLQNIISHKGFKALAFVGGSADFVYAIDYDLNRLYWKAKLSSAVPPPPDATPTCPGGLTATTRAAAVETPGGPPPGSGPRNNAPIANAVYAVSSGGLVHTLNPHTGEDLLAPVPFLPPNAKVVGSILVDNVLYAATADTCGGAANGLWAVDLRSDEKTVTKWDTKGGSVVGSAGPTFGTNGSIYVATGDGASGPGSLSNSVVALEPTSLALRDHFTVAKSAFSASPAAFHFENKHLVVAANKDGRLYVLDAAALGGRDHGTPLSKSPRYANTVGPDTGTLASWEETDGTRWVLAASAGSTHAATTFPITNGAVTNGSIVAFRLVDRNGTPTLEPAWVSRDLASPLAPMVMNDVVFAVASGLDRPGDPQVSMAERIRRSRPAILYAFDARTGKELWNSGSTIVSFAHAVPPSGGDSQVYVVTYDGTLYAFGLPLEH